MRNDLTSLSRRILAIIMLVAAALGFLIVEVAMAQTTVPPDQIDFSGLSNLAMWTILLGMGVPWLAGIINRSDFSSTVKWVTFAFVCVVAGVGQAYFQGLLTGTSADPLRQVLIIGILASAFYQWWKPAIKEVEWRTTPTEHRAPTPADVGFDGRR